MELATASTFTQSGGIISAAFNYPAVFTACFQEIGASLKWNVLQGLSRDAPLNALYSHLRWNVIEYDEIGRVLRGPRPQL
jgi:hypothetical protein